MFLLLIYDFRALEIFLMVLSDDLWNVFFFVFYVVE